MGRVSRALLSVATTAALALVPIGTGDGRAGPDYSGADSHRRCGGRGEEESDRGPLWSALTSGGTQRPASTGGIRRGWLTAGTALDTPVDDSYTAASGTSMATPHVTGAAASLAQQRPDWKGDQLTSTLMASARPGAETRFERQASAAAGALMVGATRVTSVALPPR
jgi:subtilisin family serine protease